MNRIERDWQTYAGISVVAFAAAVMSFAAWADLGSLVGITQHLGHVIYLAWLLPLSVDVYAITTARVWQRSTTASDRTRTFAKRSSIGAIVQSVAGNALYHLIVATDFTTSDWWPVVVVLVSGIPAFQLGLALHLAALVARDRADAQTGLVDHPLPVQPVVLPDQSTDVPETSPADLSKTTEPDQSEEPAVDHDEDRSTDQPARRSRTTRTARPRTARRTSPKVRSIESGTTNRLDRLRTDFPKSIPSNGEIKTALGIKSQGTANDLRKALIAERSKKEAAQ